MHEILWISQRRSSYNGIKFTWRNQVSLPPVSTRELIEVLTGVDRLIHCRCHLCRQLNTSLGKACAGSGIWRCGRAGLTWSLGRLRRLRSYPECNGQCYCCYDGWNCMKGRNDKFQVRISFDFCYHTTQFAHKKVPIYIYYSLDLKDYAKAFSIIGY